MNIEQNKSVQVHEGGGPTKELLVSQHVDMLFKIYPELFEEEEREATALWVEQSIDRLIKHQEDCIRTRAYDEAEADKEWQCPDCHGQGVQKDGSDCSACKGSGHRQDTLVDCPRCKGTGKTTSGMAGFSCEVCDGTGKTLPTHSEDVKKAIAENAKVYVDMKIGGQNYTVTMEPATYELLLDRFKRRMNKRDGNFSKLVIEFFMPDGTEMQGFGCYISGIYEAKSLTRATVYVDRMVGRMRHI